MPNFSFESFLKGLPQGPVLVKYPDLLVVALAAKAHHSQSLTPLAIGASFITGLIHTHHPSMLPFSLLAGFYLTSSKFTKLKADTKAALTCHEDGTRGGDVARNATQVFANSLTASVLIVLQSPASYGLGGLVNSSSLSQLFLVGVICHYAAVCADTWSSELGILSKGDTFLITTLKKCPKGTNGGISSLGLGVAVAAGAFIGTISSLFIYSPVSQFVECVSMIAFTSGMGLFGSLLDSVLGATLQESVVEKEHGIIVEGEGGGKLTQGESQQKGKYKVVSGINVLSNNQVNLLTSIITSVVGMGVWYYLFI